MEHPAASCEYRVLPEFKKDPNGNEEVVIRNLRGASVQVRLQGGQVISWRNDKGEELLFTSSKTKVTVKSPKAIRGGMYACLCFPQFGKCLSREEDGYARNKIWAFEKNPPPLHLKDSVGQSWIDLVLKPSEEDDYKYWPHGFEFHLRVSLASDGNLLLISRIRNISGEPFSFYFLYHSYFSVSDISEVRVEGLETVDYLDNLCERKRFTEGNALTFESEVDRDYLRSPPCVAVLDHERRRTYIMRKEGLPDTVVWNPWDKKSKKLTDFGAEDYRRMVCVDGAVIEKSITLKPAHQWTGHMEIVCLPTTVCTDALPSRFKSFGC